MLVMKVCKSYLYIGIVLFSLALACAFYYGDFFLEAGLIYGLVWGKLMLFDLYLGFAVFSLLIQFFEKSLFSSLMWIVSLLCLGNLIALIYLLYRSEDIYESLTREKV